MKKTVHAIMAAAVVATALAAKADTVVWYTFDDLGDVGTSIADSSTIQNKANPGVHDATAYGMVGMTKTPGSTRKAIVTNGIDSVMRIVDPVGDTASSDVDSALHFWAGNPAGNGMTLEIPNDAALRPSAFTVEMFVRYFEEPSNWQTLACQPSRSGKGYAWRLACYKDAKGNAGLWFTNETTQVERRCGVGDFDFSDRKWHHVAFTYAPHATDPTKCVIKVYFDYNKINEWNGVEFVIDWPDSADCPIQIGGTTVEHSAFCGEISEFRFSSGAMDPGEFLRPHNAAIDKDVVLYYDFEESNVYDGNFGTTENNLLNKASPILPGKFATRDFTEKGTLPKIDGEAASDSRIRQSMKNCDWTDNTASLFNGYEDSSIDGRRNNYLYCDLPSSVSLADADFTVEAFYKTDGDLVWLTSLVRDNSNQFSLGVGTENNKFRCGVMQDDNTEMYAKDTASANDGKWHHIALVRDGRTLTLYRDKKEVASETLTSDSLTTFTASTPRWQFGGSPAGFYTFNGWMDSVRITRRALEPEEFLTSQKYQTVGHTIAHLKFDDGTANAADGGCALFNGVINSATFSDKVPGYKIIDGEGGAVLSKPDVASLSIPSTGANVAWSNWDDQYYLRKDTNGVERTSGTVELWVKGSVKKTFAAILDAKITADGTYNDNLHAWRLAYDASNGGKPSVFFRYLKTDGTRDNQRLTFDKEVTDDKWHHWAFTFQPNASDSTKSDIAFYLDHDQLGTVQTLPGRVAYDDTLRFTIGESSMSFTGLIDEVRISDCVLTPAQFLRATKQPGLAIIVK